MSAIEFEAFPKIARLNRNMVITEKLDGTNAAVVIVPLEQVDRVTFEDGRHINFFDPDQRNIIAQAGGFVVLAQSRNRFVTPEADNYGFAGWVQRNAPELVTVLGEGRHYGEWWGSGIQRKYGLSGADKRFSLFNTNRWRATEFEDNGYHSFGLGVVPTLYEGMFDNGVIGDVVHALRTLGSVAAPGFLKPEGIVVFQSASRTLFKVTCEGDEAPKGAAGHALDTERIAA